MNEWIPLSWELNPKRTNDHGYIEVSMPTHPHANVGWCLEHRLVMENYQKRFLNPKEWVVHHVNEIKTDNRIQNLFLATPEEHAKIHRLGAKHSSRVKAKVRKQRQKIHFQRDSYGRFKKKI